MINLEDYIKEQLNEIDVAEIVRQEVKNEINSTIKRELKKWTEEKVNGLIETEIEIALDKKVHTDDGWGNKKTYDSFEHLFKTVFQEKLNSSYEIKNLISRHVKDSVDKLYQKEAKSFFTLFKDYLFEKAGFETESK